MSVNCVNITLLEKTVWELILELCIRKQDHINVTFVVWHFLLGETKSNIWRNIIKNKFSQKVGESWSKLIKLSRKYPKMAKKLC